MSTSPKPPNNPIKPIRAQYKICADCTVNIMGHDNPSRCLIRPDAKVGSTFLADSGLIEADGPMTLDRLANVLLTASCYQGLADIPHLVFTSAAFIICDMTLTAQADGLVSKVTSSLNNLVITAIASHIAQLFNTSGKLSSLNTSLVATQDKLEEMTKVIISQHQNDSSTPSPPLGEDLAMIKSAIADLKDLISTSGPPPQPVHSPYRDALFTQQKPREAEIQASDNVRANAVRKERQLLLDIALDHLEVSNV